MVAPSFGFSVGDFVAAVQLSITIVKALEDSSGAALQYQQAVIKLEALRSLLISLQALEPRGANDDMVRRIQLCAHACSVPVSTFVDEIRKFDQHLGQQHRGPNKLVQRLASGGRKVQWALAVEKALATLEARIAPYLALTDILLHLEASERTAALQYTSDASLGYIKTVISKLDRLEAAVANTMATRNDAAQLLRLTQHLTRQTNEENSDILTLLHANRASAAEITSKITMLEGMLRNSVNNPPTQPAPGKAHHIPGGFYAASPAASAADCSPAVHLHPFAPLKHVNFRPTLILPYPRSATPCPRLAQSRTQQALVTAAQPALSRTQGFFGL
ncbi:hypothetical protein LTR85_000487 [Meristemomyces frigidus]|nr:hypothetical protein LTR85_000487 [Meristemomyces frigidus]